MVLPLAHEASGRGPAAGDAVEETSSRGQTPNHSRPSELTNRQTSSTQPEHGLWQVSCGPARSIVSGPWHGVSVSSFPSSIFNPLQTPVAILLENSKRVQSRHCATSPFSRSSVSGDNRGSKMSGHRDGRRLRALAFTRPVPTAVISSTFGRKICCALLSTGKLLKSPDPQAARQISKNLRLSGGGTQASELAKWFQQAIGFGSQQWRSSL